MPECMVWQNTRAYWATQVTVQGECNDLAVVLMAFERLQGSSRSRVPQPDRLTVPCLSISLPYSENHGEDS
jgi:hypothetical protein